MLLGKKVIVFRVDAWYTGFGTTTVCGGKLIMEWLACKEEYV